MFYNVIVKELDDDMYSNRLIFTFYEIEKAIKFAKYMLNISGYSIEILQLEDKGE